MDFAVSTFRCGDPKITWISELQARATNCISTQAQTSLNLFTNIVQAIADFAFSILPMISVARLNIPNRKKKLLLAALGLTLLTGVAGAIKTYYAATFEDMDLSWGIFKRTAWFGG